MSLLKYYSERFTPIRFASSLAVWRSSYEIQGTEVRTLYEGDSFKGKLEQYLGIFGSCLFLDYKFNNPGSTAFGRDISKFPKGTFSWSEPLTWRSLELD